VGDVDKSIVLFAGITVWSHLTHFLLIYATSFVDTLLVYHFTGIHILMTVLTIDVDPIVINIDSRDSIVGTATRWTIPGSNPGRGEILRNLPERPRG
jgi:hypothetical protein